MIYHVGDQPFTYSVFLCGGTLVLGRRPNPAHIAEMISEEKVTALWAGLAGHGAGTGRRAHGAAGTRRAAA